LVIQILLPDTDQPDPSRTARVCIMRASEPASGSDIPKHIDVRPAIRSGSATACAVGLACASTWLGPLVQCATAKPFSQ
jgi:hypothetical protein